MKSRIYERRREGTVCLTYDDGNTTAAAVAVARECRQEGEKNVRRTQNSRRTIVDARRDDGIFITTRFAPGIILGTFPRELSGRSRFCKRVPPRACTGNEFACRQHVLSAFFFFLFFYVARDVAC